MRKRVNRKSYRPTWSSIKIHPQYARLVHQLTLEAEQGDKDSTHEAIRRGGYARRMLDAFSEEIDRHKGSPLGFRSKTFTPVLQRQVRGIPDNYAPFIRSNVSGQTNTKPTIADATDFYLGHDPLDPSLISAYRRNLLYIREAKWALHIIRGGVTAGSRNDFKWSLAMQDCIMGYMGVDLANSDRPEANREIMAELIAGDLHNPPDPVDDDTAPEISYPELRAIVFEGLDDYFQEEIDLLVCICTCFKSADTDHPAL